MKRFKEYTQITETEEYAAVISVMEFLDYIKNDYQETLNEGVLEKFGITAHNNSKGLLAIIKDGGVLLVKLFAAAVKGDKEEVKRIANTEISKADVINFLLKLDTATLHLISGPLHSIEAWTGWHLGAASKKAAEISGTVVNKIKDATTFIKQKVSGLSDKAAKKIQVAANAIERLANPPTILEGYNYLQEMYTVSHGLRKPYEYLKDARMITEYLDTDFSDMQSDDDSNYILVETFESSVGVLIEERPAESGKLYITYDWWQNRKKLTTAEQLAWKTFEKKFRIKRK